MASPDTDELATVPLPTGTPEAEKAPARDRADAATRPADERTAPRSEAAQAHTLPREAAEAHTVPQERVEPERIEAASAGLSPGSQERVEPEEIEAATPEPVAPERERGRWWRGLTGSLAAGLAVLAIGVLVVAGICLYTGAPGPGAAMLIGHPVAAVLALSAQRVVDRRNGAAAVGAGVAVVLFTVSALTLFWLT